MKLNLETERLLLRPFKIEDAESMFYNWANDYEVTKYMTWNPHKNIEETKEKLSVWIEQYEKPERINFAIVLKDNNELIGGIDVCGYIESNPVIGYTLSRKYWNKGYMTEACKEVIRFLFSLGYSTIRIDAVVDNIGSNKVIKKCGGIYQDTIEQLFPLKNKAMLINRYVVIKQD